MAMVIVAVVGVIIYRIAIAAVLSTTGQGIVKGRAGLIASATAACINLVIIFILNFVSIQYRWHKICADKVLCLSNNLSFVYSYSIL